MPPSISSKEPRFGRRIDPVTNTFENRLTQVSKFKHPEKNNFIFRLSHFLKKTSPKKTSEIAPAYHRLFRTVPGIVKMVFAHFHARMASVTGFKSEGFLLWDSFCVHKNPDRRSYGCKPAVECICNDSGKDLALCTGQK